MARDKTRDLRKGTRRNFLRKLSAMGISGAALQYMTKDALAEYTDKPKDEIPILSKIKIKDKLRDDGLYAREPVYEVVPRDKWAKTMATHDANKKVGKILDDMGTGSLVTSAVTTLSDKGGSEKAVVVNYTKLDKRILPDEEDMNRGDEELVGSMYKTVEPDISYKHVEENLPNKVRGEFGSGEYKEVFDDIPVILQKDRSIEQGFTGKYDPIPGGCRIRTMRWQLNGCTSGTQAWDHKNSKLVMITAGHCVDGRMDDISYQPGATAGGEFGTPVDKLYEEGNNDAGTIDFSQSTRLPTLGIAAEDENDGTDWDIEGIIASDKIVKEEGNTSYNIIQQGASSGRSIGYIDEADTDDTLGSVRLSNDVDTEGGDSGGPYFRLESGEAYMVGIHAWGGDNPRGNMVEKIEDYFDLEVTKQSCPATGC